MADPITLSSISLGASAGGGILSAFGALGEGKSTRQMYDYQASVAKLNADIDRQNAEWELTKGGTESLQYGLKAAQQFGAIRTGQAASGLDVNTGSAKAVQDSQVQIARMDEATIRNNAAKTAYDYTVRATMDENQAQLYRTAGANAERASYLKAASSIIGTAGSVSSKWLQAQQSGIYGASVKSSNPYYGPLDAMEG